jgi:hypothetical protein
MNEMLTVLFQSEVCEALEPGVFEPCDRLALMASAIAAHWQALQVRRNIIGNPRHRAIRHRARQRRLSVAARP